MSATRDYMLLEYGGLRDGAVLSGQLCPSCNGGMHGERSMSVGRKDGLLWWRCHRNKCAFRGMHGAKRDSGNEPAIHPPGRWNYEMEPLPAAWLKHLSERFNIPSEVLDSEWKWTDSYGGRVVMPIRDERGITTGFTLRSYNSEEKVKALAHRLREQVGQAWYASCPYPSHVVIVEDQPSALRASQFTGVNTIALLGTHIPDTLLEILRHTYTHRPLIVVALDQDATQEAVKQVVKLRNNCPELRVFPLEEDIKNMDNATWYTNMTRIRRLT